MVLRVSARWRPCPSACPAFPADTRERSTRRVRWGPVGLHRLGVQFADASGVIVRPAGIVAYSQTLGGLGAINAGQSWNLQCWHHNVFSPCGITNKPSNGLSVQFTP